MNKRSVLLAILLGGIVAGAIDIGAAVLISGKSFPSSCSSSPGA